MPALTLPQVRKGVAKILNNIDDSRMTIPGGWEILADADGVELWAATENATTHSFKPTVAELEDLKEWLNNLFKAEKTHDYDVKACANVDICFHWRTSNQKRLDDETDPA